MRFVNRIALAVVSIVAVGVLNVTAAEPWNGKLVQYGRMHDAIGKRQHQGRVQLSELVKRPHFNAVAALEFTRQSDSLLDLPAAVSNRTALAASRWSRHVAEFSQS